MYVCGVMRAARSPRCECFLRRVGFCELLTVVASWVEENGTLGVEVRMS